jgi:hypothetical protein
VFSPDLPSVAQIGEIVVMYSMTDSNKNDNYYTVGEIQTQDH